MPYDFDGKSEAQRRAEQLNQAQEDAAQEAKQQRDSLDAQAEQDAAADLTKNPPETTEDGTDAEFESWFASASAEAAEQVKKATGKSPDQYTGSEGAISEADLGLEDGDLKDSEETEENDVDLSDLADAIEHPVDEPEETSEESEEFDLEAELSPKADPEESSSTEEAADTVVPVNGHFNVISVGADYYNRLIAVLADRRGAYQHVLEEAKDKTSSEAQMYQTASDVCDELLQVITASALRFTDNLGNPSAALTIQDEDMNNILVILLAATYDPEHEDEDYYSQLRQYGV